MKSYFKKSITEKKQEATFNFDLKRMKDRVENEKFISVSNSSLESNDGFRRWLKEISGRNKPSHNVDKNNPDWREKVVYAKRHNLWHYHIGIPQYDSGNYGDKKSKYVIHYQLLDSIVKIVDFNQHPPFVLPTKDYLS